jgi:hypothetical protein
MGSFLAAFRNTVSILHEQAVYSERKTKFEQGFFVRLVNEADIC